jgi:hypothetical protein
MREPRRQLEFVVDTFDQILVKKKEEQKRKASEGGWRSFNVVHLLMHSLYGGLETDGR